MDCPFKVASREAVDTGREAYKTYRRCPAAVIDRNTLLQLLSLAEAFLKSMEEASEESGLVSEEKRSLHILDAKGNNG